MKIEIIGSGGCVSLPKPLCTCKVCAEARIKGRPYSRFGCSIFLHDINLLIDTPEDIVHAINQSNIKTIERILFSHADPDHVLGFRLFEQLKINWFDISEGKECNDPIDVLALPNVMDDLNAIKSKFGSYLDYYENVRHLITRKVVTDPMTIGSIDIAIVPCGDASVFVFSTENHKVVYAPCDVKPFPDHPSINDSDVLIIGNTVVGEVLKDNYVLGPDNFMKEELFSMTEILELKKRFNVKQVVITHLEEDWGKSYSAYKKLEKRYDNVQFAYDGMIIEL